MGVGQGLGAAFEAIGDAMLASSNRDYEAKKRKEANEDYIRSRVEINRQTGELPTGKAKIAEIEARTGKLNRVGGGTGGLLKTPQVRNAFATTLASVDEETRARYQANPALAFGDPIFKDALGNFVGKPGNKEAPSTTLDKILHPENYPTPGSVDFTGVGAAARPPTVPATSAAPKPRRPLSAIFGK